MTCLNARLSHVASTFHALQWHTVSRNNQITGECVFAWILQAGLVLSFECMWRNSHRSERRSAIVQALSLRELDSAQLVNASQRALQSSDSSSMGLGRKRKRRDAEEGALNGDSGAHPAEQLGRPAAEPAVENGGAAVRKDAEPDWATWDIEQPAGLQEVMRWCGDSQAWPLLRCQLQASPSSSHITGPSCPPALCPVQAYYRPCCQAL